MGFVSRQVQPGQGTLGSRPRLLGHDKASRFPVATVEARVVTELGQGLGPLLRLSFSCCDREAARGRIFLSRRKVLCRDSVLAKPSGLLSR